MWSVKRITRRKSIDIGLWMHRRLPSLDPFTVRTISHIIAAEKSPSLMTSGWATARVCRRFVMALVVLALMSLLGAPLSRSGLLITTIELIPLDIPSALHIGLLLNSLLFTITLSVAVQRMRRLQVIRWTKRPWHWNRRGPAFGRFGLLCCRLER